MSTIEVTDVAPLGLGFEVPENLWCLTHKRNRTNIRQIEDGLLVAFVSEEEAADWRRLAIALRGRLDCGMYIKSYAPQKFNYEEFRAKFSVGLGDGYNGVLILDAQDREIARRYFK